MLSFLKKSYIYENKQSLLYQFLNSFVYQLEKMLFMHTLLDETVLYEKIIQKQLLLNYPFSNYALQDGYSI